MSNKNNKLQLVTQEGEGQTIEFKEKPANLDREIVGFANAMGGSIYLGISDNNEIVGINITNQIVSHIQDIARNCDPPVGIRIEKHVDVLEIIVREGTNKPYKCQSGFYLRTGPNTQKLSRDEILSFAIGEGKIRFDEQYNSKFTHKDFSIKLFQEFLRLANISSKFKTDDILINLDVAEKQKGKMLFTNAAVLFFSQDPQKFFPEAYITAIRYRGNDRTSIVDRKDMRGDLISQVQEGLNFFKRHTEEAFIIPEAPKHRRLEEYPSSAVREALINAVMHRDYFYDSSHIYMHIYNDRLEIENPGGLFKGLTIEDLGKRSVRRNRLLAELFFRAGFIEKIGSGIARMFEAMKENGNPVPNIQATNFFNVTFMTRVLYGAEIILSDRQKQLLHFIYTKTDVSKEECATHLNTSGDTALRDIKVILKNGLIEQTGKGRATRYKAKQGKKVE